MLDVLNPAKAMDNLQAFIAAGGNVLVVIMVVTFLMWLLILERIFYYGTGSGGIVKRSVSGWADRSDTTSWYALAIRTKALSEVKQGVGTNLDMIKAFIAVLPLLGLLGTVTGMVEVFDVLASSGSTNARLMAAGITKATIPTMSGLVASLSGILMLNLFERQSRTLISQANNMLKIG